MAKWRQGSKVAVNIYKDDKIAGQFQSAELCEEAVSALNAAEPKPKALDTDVAYADSVESAARDGRQRRVIEWVHAAFGVDSVKQRAIRFLEEAVELYQACGADRIMAHGLINYVFDRKPGELGQEIGGCGVTLLALAATAGLSADGEEQRELERVLLKPLEHFTVRNIKKSEAGFVADPVVIVESSASAADALIELEMAHAALWIVYPELQRLAIVAQTPLATVGALRRKYAAITALDTARSERLRGSNAGDQK